MSEPAFPPAPPGPAALLVARGQERLRAWAPAWRRFRRSGTAVAGLAIVLGYVVVALLAPVIAPMQEGQRDAYQMLPDFDHELEPPSAAHPLGTGVGGVDLFYGVVWGSRISLAMGIAVVATGAGIGLAIGVIAGYKGGWVDELMLRFTDLFLALPLLILSMAVAIALERSLLSITLALMAAWWPSYARIARSQALVVREQPYVEASRALGATDGQILRWHILPHVMGPVLVQAGLDVGVVALVASGLAFLGFAGTTGFTADWGTMVSLGQAYLAGGPWWAAAVPGLAIFGFVMGFSLLGDGLRDMADPRGGA